MRSRCSPRPAPGEAPDPGRVVVHRIDPVLAIGNAPLIPSLARVAGFDVVHLHYPFIFGSELTLLGRLSRERRRQALLVHYKNRLVGRGPRGTLFAAYEHTVAPALIRAADRVCVLSPDHAESVPYLRRAGASEPAKLIEMPNGVDSDLFSPGPGVELRARLAIPPTRWSPPSSRRSTAPTGSSASTLRSTRSPPAGAPAFTWSSPAGASCSTAFAPAPPTPGSPTAFTSSAPSRTSSCPASCARPTCSCSPPSPPSRSGSS